MTKHWQVRNDPDGVLWLGLDYADGAANVLASAVLDELDRLLADIEGAPPKGLVVHSRKRGFIAGADLNELKDETDQAVLQERITSVHRLFDRLEALPCPSVALINGYCLGGGLELALACRYRVAASDNDVRIGFPEIRLGIFPGYGGSWRAIRTIGPLPAMRLMLTGRALRAKEAKRLGLVDMVVPERQLHDAALQILRQAPQPRRAGRLQQLPNRPLLRPAVAGVLRREAERHADPRHYPAPFRLIEHWREHGDDGPALLASEARAVSELLTGETARNLIRLFRLRERLKGLGRGKAHDVAHLHVIGAGAMGGDIAAWSALSGFRVTLQDLSAEQLGRAMKRARGLFEKRLKDPLAVRAAWDRLIPDPGGDGVGRADLVIEAIVENAEAKRRLFAAVEPRMRDGALLATNTSGIPLEELSAGLRRAESLVGLHFFNPVARMELVEVVRGPGSSPEAVDRAIAFVTALGRLPLPVASSPGFLVNRILMPYLLEAVELLQEGVPAKAIDRAAEDFGMPMGPVALADSVGLDICLAVAEEIGPRLSTPTEAPALLRERVQQGALGKKSGEGFYRYGKGKPVSVGRTGAGKTPPDLAERMIFRLLNEAVACLREEIVADADLLDAGVVFGTGFAPFRGGPMHFIAEGGQARMLSRLRELEASHGSHFHPDRGWGGALRA